MNKEKEKAESQELSADQLGDVSGGMSAISLGQIDIVEVNAGSSISLLPDRREKEPAQPLRSNGRLNDNS